jgi:dynein heavy chain
VQVLEDQITNLAQSHRIGPVLLVTEPLKNALLVECRAWKQTYGRHLNKHCGDVMDELHKYFRIMQRKLDHPLRDLDDIRAHKVGVYRSSV